MGIDFDVFKVPQVIDPLFATLQFFTAEQVAFLQAEFPPDDVVPGAGVADHVDFPDIHPVPRIDLNIQIDNPLFVVDQGFGIDVGIGIAFLGKLFSDAQHVGPQGGNIVHVPRSGFKAGQQILCFEVRHIRYGDLAYFILQALFYPDFDINLLLLAVDLNRGLVHPYADKTVVLIKRFQAQHIQLQHILFINSGFVDEGKQPGGLGFHHVFQIVGIKRFVSDETDLVDLDLFALLDADGDVHLTVVIDLGVHLHLRQEKSFVVIMHGQFLNTVIHQMFFKRNPPLDGNQVP